MLKCSIYLSFSLEIKTESNTHLSGRSHKRCRNLLSERGASSEEKVESGFGSFKKNDYLSDDVSKFLDKPSERVRVLTFENTQINLVFCSLIRNFALDDES